VGYQVDGVRRPASGVRGSMADDGLSFGTNHNAGVCIHFPEKVPSRLSKSGHSALTVTVEDLEGLTRALGGDPNVAARPGGPSAPARWGR
jgi:hypothetical protein